MFSANSSQVSEDRLYVEDVFSTYLYTGNGSTQTITNGIDLAGKGGLVWIKWRGSGSPQLWYDTARGATKSIYSNSTYFQETFANSLTSFNSNGFSLGADANANPNGNGNNYASWTFRKAPKFFDVVTYTGDGVSSRTVSHNLGVTPGCIIVKRTDTSADWIVWHRGNGTTNYNLMALNLTDASTGSLSSGDLPTATTFKPGALLGPAYNSGNNTGGTYVAYLFAHDTTSDGIIQCGSYTGTDANLSVTLGFEPQWILIKSASMSGATYGGWHIVDNMRGLNDTLSTSSPPYLKANTSAAEATANPNGIAITSTGFRVNSSWSVAPETYIYIAIRRGPMRTPTSGTSVFSPAYGNNMSVANVNAFTSGFATDLLIRKMGSGSEGVVQDALRGIGNQLYTEQTAAEAASTSYFRTQTGVARTVATDFSGWIGWNFRRAPSFFDTVCYTGTGVARTINHNLGVAPELMIVKIRNFSNDWRVYYNPNSSMYLNTNQAGGTASSVIWNDTDPTATVFSVGVDSSVNGSGGTYVAYLFASCPGVSKVGSYTGNGSSQTINCGFAAGARFVLIKRTDSTGNWLVADSARGIVAGNDPLLYLNSTAAEVTSLDWIDADSSGFVVNQDSTANANVNGATYIYLAVA